MYRDRAKTGQNRKVKDGFLFVGNQLALDFVNTRPVQDGEPIELLPDFTALVHWFRAAGLLSAREMEKLQQRWGESARARQTARAVRDFREKLRKEILMWERGSAVRHSTLVELNRLMSRYPMRTRLMEREGGTSTHMYFEPRQPEDLFAPLAYHAAMLFAHADRNRVRKCDQCVLHFQDISKKGTRRWCSMQLCGNRRKVAAYAARRRRRVMSPFWGN
jgi:predicted RNA-binding Zn ribbon-like protein